MQKYGTISSSSSIEKTTGYSGVSSSIQYYQTTLNNSAGLSSTTALTRSSSSGTSALTGAGTQTVYTQAKKSTRTESYNPGSGHCSASFDMSVTASATYLTYSLNQPFIKASGTVSLKYTTSTYSAGPSGMQQTQYTGSYTSTVLNYGSQWLLSTHYSRTFGSYGTVTYSSLYSSIAAATTGTSTLTRSSTSAYAGSSTRQATYLTSSVDQGNMSNITALTSSESISGSTTTWE